MQSWFVVAGAGQVHWLRRRALRDGLTLFGIRFLLPGALRFELCALLGVETLPLGRETLEFLLKLEAAAGKDAESLAQARTPAACLHALERLHAAGWPRALPGVPSRVLRVLGDSRAWAPALDEELLFKVGMSAAAPLRTCFFGWDASQWEHMPLFEAAFRASRSCEVYQSMPRPSAESLQQNWVKAVEARLQTGHVICRSSGFVSPNEALVSRLEAADLDASVTEPPRFFIGRDWRDEIVLIRDYILEKLAAAGPGGCRLGVVVPRRSPSSLEIVRALSEAGVALFDETGEKQERAAEALIQFRIVRYHLLGCDVEELFSLIDLLNGRPGGFWTWLSPGRARREMDKAFTRLQTRNVRVLIHAFEDEEKEEEPVRQICMLAAALGSWEGESSWAEAREKWESCLRSLGLDVRSLEPNWSLVSKLAGQGMAVPGSVFLEYLQSILSQPKTERIPGAESPYSAVIVTTFSQARRQAWDGLVFADSNEGDWPVRTEENPFLDDALCRALNARKSPRQGYLLDSAEQAAVEQSHLLDLIENCAGEIAFAAVSRSQAEIAREAYPNEWVVRALVESAPAGSQLAVLEAWRNAISVCPRPRAVLPAWERQRLDSVHKARRNPEVPFDEYLFDFRNSSYVPGEWAPAQLDKALTTPATFALKAVFGAESATGGGFERNERFVLGTRVHTWLREALAGGTEFRAFAYAEKARLALAGAVEAEERDIAERFGREGMALPLWWRSALRKAAWKARNCLAPLAEFASPFFVMEYTLQNEVATGEGTLKLSGRVDLLLSDRPALEGATVHIIDFKTGKTRPPTMAHLDKGAGFQFAAYFLQAREAGAASVTVGMIGPDNGFSSAFQAGDEADLRLKMGALARLQSHLDFGQLGGLFAEFGASETLPMATTPISPRVLNAKAKLRAISVPE